MAPATLPLLLTGAFITSLVLALLGTYAVRGWAVAWGFVDHPNDARRVHVTPTPNVGGIAVALASQNILGDLFASLSILFDKPFVVGDFIIVGDMMGTVERVGLKTTRVRSLSGEQLVFSNNDLLSSRIKNYKRMEERRVVFTLGVTYQTNAERLESIPGIIREPIAQEEKVRFDRSHFKGYGDFALLFETVYWVTEPDYNLYMDIQQKINLELFRHFEKQGIEFAYPTQTIHLAADQA